MNSGWTQELRASPLTCCLLLESNKKTSKFWNTGLVGPLSRSCRELGDLRSRGAWHLHVPLRPWLSRMPGAFTSPGAHHPAISCLSSPTQHALSGAGTRDLSRQRTKVVGERSQEPSPLWGRALQFRPFEISNSSLWTKS